MGAMSKMIDDFKRQEREYVALWNAACNVVEAYEHSSPAISGRLLHALLALGKVHAEISESDTERPEI